MKKLLAALVPLFISAGAFAQGKILFTTDSVHLVYYIVGSPLSGQALDASHMPPGINLVADLYMGTSSSQLYFYSSTTFGNAPGKWNPLAVQAIANSTSGAPAIAGGTSVFVIAQIRDSSFAPESVWTPDTATFPAIWGLSSEFSFTLGSSITYPVMYGANGNWAPGTFPLDSSAGPGSKGAIPIAIVPEPGALGLIGLTLMTGLLPRTKRYAPSYKGQDLA